MMRDGLSFLFLLFFTALLHGCSPVDDGGIDDGGIDDGGPVGKAVPIAKAAPRVVPLGVEFAQDGRVVPPAESARE